MQLTELDHIPKFKVVDNEGRTRTISHKIQEVPLNSPASCYRFSCFGDKPVVVSKAAHEHFGPQIISACFLELQAFAVAKDGLDYLQVFYISDSIEPLWIIEDGAGGAITALLPGDY
jgi:hypothetical protein